MSHYFNMHQAEQESKMRVKKMVFLNIAKLIKNSDFTYSLESIHDRLNYNYKTLSDVMTVDFRDCFQIKVLNNATKENFKHTDIHVKLTDKGIRFFFEHAQVETI